VCSITGAQDVLNGALVVGQPSIGQIAIAGESIRYAYTLNQISQITIQVLSDTVHPTVQVLRDGAVIANQMNLAAEPMVVLDSVLDAGAYIVEIGALEAATGTVMALVQSEASVAVMDLQPGNVVSGGVNGSGQVSLYRFSAMVEPAYLYYESLNPMQGAAMSLVNITTGQTVGKLEVELSGARLRIPAGSNVYRILITHEGVADPVQFTLCLIGVSGGECGQGGVIIPTAVEQSGNSVCVVTPKFAGGANIRQSASTNAPILVALLDGTSATVLGIDPTESWYNVEYNGINGWAALSAVNSAGNCVGLDVMVPPSVPPTAVPPQPTNPPVQPTNPPSPTSVPGGPCLITFSGTELIYTQPAVDPSLIFDQVQAGYELIPVGRWNSGGQDWWKTNYFNSWWLNKPGTMGTVSGDCSGLPFINP